MFDAEQAFIAQQDQVQMLIQRLVILEKKYNDHIKMGSCPHKI